MKRFAGIGIASIAVIAIILWYVKYLPKEGYVADNNSLSMQYNIAKAQADLQFQKAKQTGAWDAAIAAYKGALAIRPENAEAHNDLGAAYYQKAMGFITELIEEDLTEYGEPRETLDYMEQRIKEKSLAKFSWTVKPNLLQPLDAYVKRRGDLFYSSSRDGRNYEIILIPDPAKTELMNAQVAFYRSLDMKADYVPAYRNLGALYVMVGRKADAEKLLEEALKREPHDSDLRAYLQQLKGY